MKFLITKILNKNCEIDNSNQTKKCVIVFCRTIIYNLIVWGKLYQLTDHVIKISCDVVQSFMCAKFL